MIVALTTIGVAIALIASGFAIYKSNGFTRDGIDRFSDLLGLGIIRTIELLPYGMIVGGAGLAIWGSTLFDTNPGSVINGGFTVGIGAGLLLIGTGMKAFLIAINKAGS